VTPTSEVFVPVKPGDHIKVKVDTVERQFDKDGNEILGTGTNVIEDPHVKKGLGAKLKAVFTGNPEDATY